VKMRRWLPLILIAVLLVGAPLTPARAAIDGPITYLERDPATGRFLLKHDGGGGSSTLTTVEAITSPAISPDGTRVAFSGVVGNGSLGLYAIYLVDVNGSNLVRITSGSYGELDPHWAPDGSAVVYSQNHTGSYGSACCRIAKTVIGGATTYLTAGIGALRPEFSPDGSKVLYDRSNGIYTVSANGGTATPVVATGFDATFSPDGNSIAYLQKSGSSHLLRKVNLSSGAVTTLYSTTQDLESPVWVGSRILFIQYAGFGYDGRSAVTLRSIGDTGGMVSTERTFAGRVAGFSTPRSDPPRALVGDLDSDNRDDVVSIRLGERTVLDSNGTSFSAQDWGSVSPPTGWAEHLGGDFNGDSDMDTAGFKSSDGTWHVSVAGASSFTTTVWDDFSSASGWLSRSTGDFNGDNRDDIAQFHPSNGTWWISRSTGSDFVTGLWEDFTTASGWQSQVVGDFSGDGLDDIANFHPGNGTWWVSRSNGSGFVTTLWADFSTASGWTSRLVGDFDDDGRDDIAQYHPGNGTWWVSRSTGSGFVTTLWADFTTTGGWVSRSVGDFDGDGRDDIAQFHPGNGTWWVSRSNGGGFSTLLWADFSTPTGWSPQLVGDYNGDGRDDIANFASGNQTWWVSISSGSGFTTSLWLAE
jgi:hypothetical protein